MASVIWIDSDFFAYKNTVHATSYIWNAELTHNKGIGGKAIIAKGNIIEGIEAKE